MSNNYVIDRFEGNYAVLEDEESAHVDVERGLLYDGAKEGDRVSFDGSVYTFDEAGTLAAKERIAAKFQRNRKKG